MFLKRQEVYGFIHKMRQLVLMQILLMMIILNLLNKAKLLGNTVVQADNADNGILKNAAIAVPLKYLSNFWRSFEMPLINCNVELKLKWSNYCILSAAGNDNANGNDGNIIFTIKDTKLYIPVVTLSARDNQKLTKLSKRDLKDQLE